MEQSDELFDLSINNVLPTDKNPLIELYKHLKSVDNLIEIDRIKKKASEKYTVAALMAIYSTSQVNQNKLFKKSASSNILHSEIWSKIVSQKAINYEMTKEMNAFDSSKINKDLYTTLKKISMTPNDIIKISSLLEEIGIILIFEPTIGSSKADGMVGLTINKTPYIGLSLRQKRLDIFWFTLLHELAHLKLHSDLLDNTIIDNDIEVIPEIDIEVEANRYALNSFIPRSAWNRTDLKFGKHKDKNALINVAADLEVHPSIVAGRLRRDLNNHTIYSDIIFENNVREIIWGVE